MICEKVLYCGTGLVCGLLVLAGPFASADDKTEKSSLSGIWVLKSGETKIEFCDKKVVKICPHGDDKVIAVLCEYTVEKEGLVKAKITGYEGKDEVKDIVKEKLPLGTEFRFKWLVKDGTAKLDDLKGDQVDLLKSHLEGDYSPKK
jgi:hypothetical protein